MNGTGPVVVLANHTAGRGRHRRLLPAVLDRLTAAGRPVWQMKASTAEEAETACHAAVAGGAGALVAVGGDGTLHAALQAVAGTGVGFGVVPAGTGNDIAVGLGLPDDPLAAADALAAALATGTTHRLDLARVTAPDGRQRWFAGVLGAGFDAIVNERANRMRWPRGDRRYDLAIFLELLRLRARRYLMHLDGEPHRFDGVLVAVGNTASYGGGIRICPDADPSDGLLDVVVGARMSRATLVRLRPRAYRGTHVQHPLVRSHRAHEVRLDLERAGEVGGITTYADGERCLPLPVTVTAAPNALTVLG